MYTRNQIHSIAIRNGFKGDIDDNSILSKFFVRKMKKKLICTLSLGDSMYRMLFDSVYRLEDL